MLFWETCPLLLKAKFGLVAHRSIIRCKRISSIHLALMLLWETYVVANEHVEQPYGCWKLNLTCQILYSVRRSRDTKAKIPVLFIDAMGKKWSFVWWKVGLSVKTTHSTYHSFPNNRPEWIIEILAIRRFMYLEVWGAQNLLPILNKRIVLTQKSRSAASLFCILYPKIIY